MRWKPRARGSVETGALCRAGRHSFENGRTSCLPLPLSVASATTLASIKSTDEFFAARVWPGSTLLSSVLAKAEHSMAPMRKETDATLMNQAAGPYHLRALRG